MKKLLCRKNAGRVDEGLVAVAPGDHVAKEAAVNDLLVRQVKMDRGDRAGQEMLEEAGLDLLPSH